MSSFDVIIVGGGHAGCEAASASARRGAKTALITFDQSTLGAMSCNPAIGGLGKGHLVREVDAFDGLIGRAADQAAIHYRMLNASKGAAVQGPRVQADRRMYKAAVQQQLAEQAGLTVIAGEAAKLCILSGKVVGLQLADGAEITASAIVLATGTFLGGLMFRGEERMTGGRVGEQAAKLLGLQLRALGLPMGRLKTGTPPRLDGRTIDWAALQAQPSDQDGWTMSPLSGGRSLPQLACAITRTNEYTHDIIRAGLGRSPLFSGAIEGQGPRYCPSIEDKVQRFSDRDGHQVFLEPEGLDDHLVYPNGISTSLPADVQTALVRSMPGLEQAHISVPGYAVEYDYLDPRSLNHQLMLGALPGLFCAGQINGTTGYEEAAAQGLVAGANAAAYALGIEPLIVDRSRSYLGVMIDDLVLQGVTEPYRMLTARAEYRLRLRADNAPTRLTPLGITLGLISPERRAWFEACTAARSEIEAELAKPMSASSMSKLGARVRQDGSRRSLFEWARFPEVNQFLLSSQAPSLLHADSALVAEVMEDAHYAPYLERQAMEISSLERDSKVSIPRDFDFAAVGGLSNEMVEKLNGARPSDLGAAGRIRGITPAALSAIWVALKKAA